MPERARWIALCNQVTYFIDVVRLLVLKGIGINDIQHQFIVLAGMAIFSIRGQFLTIEKQYKPVITFLMSISNIGSNFMELKGIIMRTKTITIWLFISSICTGAFSQTTNRLPLVIGGFEYLYSGNAAFDNNSLGKGNPIDYGSPRIVFALKDSFLIQMSNSLLHAINQYWDSDLNNVLLYVEGTGGMFREYPKFKPKLPKNSSNTALLFLRIVDRFHTIIGIPYDFSGSLAGLYSFECKVFNGNNGSEIFSRVMEVEWYRKPVPDGQFLLTQLPGMANSFLSAFDSAAATFFNTSAPEKLRLEIEPACLFVNLATSTRIKQSIKFSYDNDKIMVTEGLELAWILRDLERQKTGKTKKSGYGVGSGLFSLATGIENEKERTKTNHYLSRFLIDDPSTNVLYGFHIPLQEIESEFVSTMRMRNNDGSKSIEKDKRDGGLVRKTLPGCFITRGNDTIGSFDFTDRPVSRKKDGFSYYWNGRDSSSISLMPAFWSPKVDYSLLAVEGMLYGSPFIFSNSKAGNQLDVWYNEKQVATFKMKNGRPSDGILYENDLPYEVLKVLAMFTSLPYDYYGK